jgi:1-deoxy-D-xylulose-5-phosphate reductoisomerase
VALGAARSVDTLADQAAALHPAQVAIADSSLAPQLRERVPQGTEVLAGPDALAAIARSAEVVLNGVVGFAGLPVTLAALESGRRLALANKESLIAGGPVVQRARATDGAEIIPVDSEHCAVHQCLHGLRAGKSPPGDGSESAQAQAAPSGNRWPSVRRIILTASGGPFRGRGLAELTEVTVADALAHPTWRMGPKITIDSSTLMNKGLEVIEAHQLFGIDYDRIDVVVHPQSIVHSMVEATDGATLAQLSQPDMRLPIGYALAYPDRLETAFGPIDWTVLSRLDFELPDRAVFRCLELAYQAGRLGGTAPACLSAANEVAVDAFLGGRIRWTAIAEVIEETLARVDAAEPDGVEAVLEADRWARREAGREVVRRVRVA